MAILVPPVLQSDTFEIQRQKINGLETYLTDKVNTTINQFNSQVNAQLNIGFEIANPLAAISYGDYMYVWSYNRHNGITRILKINVINRNTTVISQYNDPSGLNETQHHVQVSTLKTASGKKVIAWQVWSNNFYTLDPTTDNITRIAIWNDLGIWQKPIYIDDVGQGTNGTLTYSKSSYPDLYLINSEWSAWPGDLINLTGYRNSVVNTSNRDYNYYELPQLNLLNQSFTNSNIFNKLEPAHVNLLFCDINPIKKRLYFQTDGTGLLHIFSINYSGNVVIGWFANDPNRLSYLKYEKSIAVNASDAYWRETYAEHPAIEYDLDTGQEKYITFVRRGHTEITGTVRRTPWIE